jgi:hypothetical protein
MMTVNASSTVGWDQLWEAMPEDAEQLAKTYGVVETKYGRTRTGEQRAKIATACDLVHLLLLCIGANLGLRQAAAMFLAATGIKVSHVAVHHKMRLCGPYLGALVSRLAAADATAPERWAGYDVQLVDASTWCSPGAETTSARVHARIRLCSLEILDAQVTDKYVGETFKNFAWKQGQLAVGDRGYGNAPGIAHVVSQGADVLVRVNRNSLPMLDSNRKSIDLVSWLRSLRGEQPHERVALVHDKERGGYVAGRLIAQRLPSAAAEKARARVRRELGTKVKELDLELAQYIWIFTTVDRKRMGTVMCLELYRLRWQVELTFKRWKSLCEFDQMPNFRNDTIHCWLYGKLLLALLLQKAAQPSFPPEGSAWFEQHAVLPPGLEDSEHLVAADRFGIAAA